VWRKLHNEELNGLYYSPNVIRVIKSRRMTPAGHVARMGAYRVMMGILEGKRSLGRTRSICKGRGGWILVNTVMNLQGP
jgi:hypothetical protein